RMMLADPRLVIVQPVEVLEQLEVALDRQGRIFVMIVERREKDAAAQIELVHAVSSGGIPHPSLPPQAEEGRVRVNGQPSIWFPQALLRRIRDATGERLVPPPRFRQGRGRIEFVNQQALL